MREDHEYAVRSIEVYLLRRIKILMMRYFFWIAFAVFLAASIPHVAYFFASFEPTDGPEGIWWWVVSYAIAISIDVTVYLLSWTAFRRYRKYRTAKAVWQHWLLITICTVFSWIVNWAYARQFHNASMLSSAESAAPWLVNVFPFMASAFPLLGIVYTMMAETVTEAEAEDKQRKMARSNLLSEISKQTQLPVDTLRRALIGGTTVTQDELSRPKEENQPSEVSSERAVAPATGREIANAITGQVIAIENSTGTRSRTTRPVAAVSSERHTDKLQLTIEALKQQPDISDSELANHLALKRAASARFWRLKATEVLKEQDKDFAASDTLDSGEASWITTGPLTNSAPATAKQ